MIIHRLTILFIVASIFVAGESWSKDLGLLGKTYPIVEPDGVAEIKARAEKLDWEAILKSKDREEQVKSYKPSNITYRLPRARRNTLRFVDMSYTLEMDIPDGQGGILYPKGYTFNPLAHLSYTKTLVIIDGTDDDQITWFRSSKYFSDHKVMLLLSDGKYFDVAQGLERPVFYISDLIMRRLQLQAVPSIVAQKGLMMEVSEIEVPISDKK